ncbi:hypothetical protein QBC35DRAFT_377943 [Podospora australis]|uniref:Autophagy-related protein 101 n=1 Tax=Podospora australis TaxID=1536484 RepID=A0AAN6WZC1_9PEZI|nr:hypothetical protein QBC35DRAFT_377943 [Podospora australis]
MEQRGPPEFILEAFSDPNSVRDVVRGILHTIFFLRFFPSVLPATRDVLGLELAYLPEPEIETLIDQRATALARQLDSERHQAHHTYPPSAGSGRGQITVQFFEKRRKKTWYAISGDDEVCWESWTIRVTVAEPRTESDRAKVRKAAETTLQNSVMKAVTLANQHKEHIPPITKTEANPFPYQIIINNNSNNTLVGGGGGDSRSSVSRQQQQSQQQTQQAQKKQQQKEGAAAAALGSGPSSWAARMGIY